MHTVGYRWFDRSKRFAAAMSSFEMKDVPGGSVEMELMRPFGQFYRRSPTLDSGQLGSLSTSPERVRTHMARIGFTLKALR
jgi:hypothetical protein